MASLLTLALWLYQHTTVEWVCEGNSYMLLDPEFDPVKYGCTPSIYIEE